MEFTNIPSLTSPPKSTKEGGSKPKSVNKLEKDKSINLSPKPACTYTQALATNIWDILKLKENFPKLSDKKIKEIYKMVNNLNILKPKLNMMTKDLLCKQIIIPISSNNIKNFMATSNNHVTNINQSLKNIKSDIAIDFIHPDYRGLILVSNKVVVQSDISIISNHIKNASNMNANNIWEGWLLQSKSYLKILGLPYLIENINTPIDAEVAKSIIKSTYIFNDIKVALKSCIYKVLPKLNMAIIWINIWDL